MRLEKQGGWHAGVCQLVMEKAANMAFFAPIGLFWWGVWRCFGSLAQIAEASGGGDGGGVSLQVDDLFDDHFMATING